MCHGEESCILEENLIQMHHIIVESWKKISTDSWEFSKELMKASRRIINSIPQKL